MEEDFHLLYAGMLPPWSCSQGLQENQFIFPDAPWYQRAPSHNRLNWNSPCLGGVQRQLQVFTLPEELENLGELRELGSSALSGPAGGISHLVCVINV